MFWWRRKDRATDEVRREYKFHVKRERGRKNGRVTIMSDQTLSSLDAKIRKALGLDTWDHCSAFFKGEVWRSRCFAEVYPDGSGKHADMRIGKLPLEPGDTMSYVYDFGDDIRHIVTLEEIADLAPHLAPKSEAGSQPRA